MNEFHPHEVHNELFLPHNADCPACVAQHDATMKPDAVVQRRSAIKLSSGPKILVCIPIGGKGFSTILECPQCKAREEDNSRFEVQDGFQIPAMVNVNFMLQHMNWLPPLNVTIAYTFKTGMLSAAAREVMTLEALKTDTIEYLFFVDDDMIIPPMGLYTLYNRMEQNPTWGAASGVYTTRQDPPEPLVYTDHGHGAAWDFEMGPGANPTQIMGAGAGCLLVRMAAIKDWMKENISSPVWCDSIEFPASNAGRVTWGHDVRLIRNLTEAGWPCFVDGQVLCGHFDVRTGKVFNVPTSAPGLKKRSLNTETYWDAIYMKEGMDTWRTYEEMYSHIVEHVEEHCLMDVLELGCGSGVLGQRMTATVPCKWTGLDLSPVAVAQAKARYLDAHVMDVRQIRLEDLSDLNRDCIVATELLEHLMWEECEDLLAKINESGVGQLLFSTPWECMPPSEVPEHEVLVDQEWLDAVQGVLTKYTLKTSTQVDDVHRVHIWSLNAVIKVE